MFLGYLVVARMHKLLNTVMDYDWGSHEAIADFLGRPSPTAAPEAEMWIGAHASAPSLVADHGKHCTLAEWIAESPDARLGLRVRERFGPRLPFLLKLLAAEVPLSLQVHPNLEQARTGYDRENALGIELSARRRNYKDANPKPEILCALGRFDALCGFRPVAQSLELLEALAVASLTPVVDELRRRPGAAGLEAAFSLLMKMPRERAASLVAEVAEACRRESARNTESSAQLDWTVRLAGLHPGDVGVAASLLLNHVRLEAGEALFLRSGSLHSYLSGVGIELMGSSDNVVRGGLTSKHVDVDELLAVVDFSDHAVRPVAQRILGEHETQFVTDATRFRLSTVVLEATHSYQPSRRGPELLLCASGVATATTASGKVAQLRRGESVFVGADDEDYVLSGDATLFRATVGDEAA